MAGAIVYEKVVKEDLDIGTDQVDITNPAGGVIRANRINLASFAFATYTATWTPGSIPVGGQVATTIQIPGIVKGDFALVSWSGTHDTHVIVQPFLFIDGFITVAMIDVGLTVPMNPGTGTLRILIFKTSL